LPGLSRSYIAGLFDGDGSFLVELKRHPSIPTGLQIMPRIVLSLSSRDSAVLEEVKASFPSLNFKLKSLKCGCVQLRLSNLRDISCFIKEVKPYLRVFTNVRRAEILEEIVDFILERLHGRHYGSRENFKPLLSRIAEMRRYSKRGMGAKHYDISATNI